LRHPRNNAAVKQHGDIGYVSLNVSDPQRAARFYGAVLGWDVEQTDGRYRVRDAGLPTGIVASAEPPTLFCCYVVRDIGRAVAAIRSAGGQADDPHRRPEGRTADCIDNQGVSFAVYQPAATEPRESGDLAYVTVALVDAAKGRDFYGAVLGWRFETGSVPDGWRVRNTVPLIGLHGGHSRSTAVPMWRVPDVDSAVEAVRVNGGSADEPEDHSYGRTANCTDDQGMRFYLGAV
jgi:predicted enzyme related to lactoylglutathione lyase